MNYYDDKKTFLEKIFGKVLIKNNTILINNKSFEIKDDVIFLNSLEEEKNNDKKLNIESFSKEWEFFNKINSNNFKFVLPFFYLILVLVLFLTNVLVFF